jgi:hypothetical protein
VTTRTIYTDIEVKLTDLTNKLRELQGVHGIATQAEEIITPTVLRVLHDNIESWDRLLEELRVLHEIEHGQ